MSEKQKIVVAANKDNELLHPCGNERFIVGHVDEVNGAGAVEVPDFVPTRHELIQLVKFWAEVALQIDFECFVTSSSGSTEMRLEPFAWRRINRIAATLGDDEVKKAVDEVYAKFGEKQNKRYWDVFLNGTKEQMAVLQEEIQRKLDESPKGEPK